MNAAEVSLTSASEYGVPPSAAWDYYNRLNRRAVVELLPVKVASYIGKVDEPQLKAMFETAAEVLGGLKKAFHDYEQKKEKAWQP